MLANSKLSIEVFISKALIDSNISHDEVVLMNNVIKEYGDMKEKIKTLGTSWPFRLNSRQFIEKFSLFIKQCYCIVWSVEKIQKVKTQTF